MPTPEEKARQRIDEMLVSAGWVVQDYKQAHIHAGRGVVLRNFPLTSGLTRGREERMADGIYLIARTGEELMARRIRTDG
jgi:hypothetical protein